MKIKEAERRTGLSADNIRYYEERGLLSPRRSAENNYREYDEEDVANRLKAIEDEQACSYSCISCDRAGAWTCRALDRNKKPDKMDSNSILSGFLRTEVRGAMRDVSSETYGEDPSEGSWAV